MAQAHGRVTLPAKGRLTGLIALTATVIVAVTTSIGCTAGISGNTAGSGSGGSGPGAPSTGGSPGPGGTSGSGGVSATGGRGTGGLPGQANTGGESRTGGNSGSGGRPGTGRDAGTTDAPGSGATGGAPVTGTGNDASAQLCVDTINMYRATLGLAPYARWTEQEACVSNEALLDSQTNTAHSAFGMCTESAQNECPGWSGSLASIVTGCLQQMWAEGPGADFNTHGHYINMSSTRYTRVACGFATAANGRIWAAQDFR